jgi:hypothetical protein
MVRQLTGAALVLLASALVYGGEGKAATKEVAGTIKSVSASQFTVMSGGKDMTFMVDNKETTVVERGGSHKFDRLKEDGKPALINDFLSPNQKVSVKYFEKDGKMVAKDVRVTE